MQPVPLAWPGGAAPLWVDHPASAQIPEVMRAMVPQQWGYPPAGADIGGVQILARAGLYGLNSKSEQQDDFDQYQAPSEASEAVRPIVVQRCIDVDEDDISEVGTAFELTRIVHVPSAAIGIVERLPTMLNVEALDANKDPIFTFGNTNGQDPCLDELQHPDAAVGPLTWVWRIVMQHVPSNSAPNLPLAGPAGAGAVMGDDLVPPWTDIRYGDLSRWGDRQQFVVRPSTQVRYWVTFFGPSGRYRIRVGARLAGYWQLGGRRGAALESVTDRIV